MTPPRQHRIRPAATALVAALCVGAGGGAAVYAAFSDHGTKTVVRQVTVTGAQPAASVKSALSVHDIYQRTYRAAVEISVSLNQQRSDPFGGSQSAQAQASGWVYDSKGDIVTNQHVVDGASSISVKFWNGATYRARVIGTDPSTDLAVIHVDAPSSLLVP